MQPTNLKQALRGKLTKKQLAIMPRSYDIIGDIAILDIPEELEKKEKIIAQTLLDMIKPIQVVTKKVGKHTGRYRLQKVKILSGQRRKTTLYKESGVRMKVHVENSYFSPRFGTERLRIAQRITPGEDILVMFSGVAPFPLVFARWSKAKHIVGIELNPRAHKLGEENVQLNKFKNITLYCGDVREVVPRLKKKFDRICMPLPKGGDQFLDVALQATRKGGIIHFYDFLHQDEFGLAKEKVKRACLTAKKRCRALRLVKCGQASPRTWRICLDVKIL